MKKLDVVAFESYRVDKNQKPIPVHILDKLYEFLSKSHHVASTEEFLHLIIKPKEQGELVVLYGLKDDIAGFCRIFRQEVYAGTKKVRAYTALIYLNPLYNPYPTSDSMGLNQGIKYKLEHPEEEVIYLAFVNNPYSYEFFYQFIESFYPKPSQQVPEQVLKIVEALKKHNGWISTGNHPMIVNSPLVPIRSYKQDNLSETSELEEFYSMTNPDYMQGNALLIYIPLHLANIYYGLNPPSLKTYYENPPHHLHEGQEDSHSANPSRDP